MNNFYLYTERIDDVIKKSDKLSFEELDSLENRLQATVYLAEIYKSSSTIKMTVLDYKNVYNILYVICLPKFGKSLQPNRISIAKDHINKIKSGDINLEELIDRLLFNGH